MAIRSSSRVKRVDALPPTPRPISSSITSKDSSTVEDVVLDEGEENKDAAAAHPPMPPPMMQTSTFGAVVVVVVAGPLPLVAETENDITERQTTRLEVEIANTFNE